MPAKAVTRSRLRDQGLVRALNEKLAAHRPSRMFIEFFCECGRASCDESIPLGADEFEALRRVSGHFAVSPGHHRPERERIVEIYSRYVVVARAPA